MKRNISLVFLILAGAILATASVTTNVQTASNRPMVYVRATAIERDRGRVVSGLSRENFKVFEDNVPQDIASFTASENPMTVGILLDVAESSRSQAKEMASRLAKSASPEDKIYFADSGNSPIGDAVYQELNKLTQVKNGTRALVLYTTSSDPAASPFTKAKELLRREDVRFYVVSVPTRSDLSFDQGKSFLADLAEMSGGAAYFPQATQAAFQVPDIYSKIARELKYTYLIGYRSTNVAADGKWRKVRITVEVVERGKVNKPAIHAKSGYYAPTAARP